MTFVTSLTIVLGRAIHSHCSPWQILPLSLKSMTDLTILIVVHDRSYHSRYSWQILPLSFCPWQILLVLTAIRDKSYHFHCSLWRILPSLLIPWRFLPFSTLSVPAFTVLTRFHDRSYRSHCSFCRSHDSPWQIVRILTRVHKRSAIHTTVHKDFIFLDLIILILVHKRSHYSDCSLW
jgi:hypothetical protein